LIKTLWARILFLIDIVWEGNKLINSIRIKISRIIKNKKTIKMMKMNIQMILIVKKKKHMTLQINNPKMFLMVNNENLSWSIQ